MCIRQRNSRKTTHPNQSHQQPDPQTSHQKDIPEDLVLDAIKALLPDDLLDRIAAQKARQGKGNGSGAARKGNRRGRPLPARQGRLSDGARIDLIGTLRAATPWQTIRRKTTGRDGLHIRQSDIHVKQFEERSDRVLIFAVDVSGSSAISRLAEAKGAIESLLAKAYARRDNVSLVAFRGHEADTASAHPMTGANEASLGRTTRWWRDTPCSGPERRVVASDTSRTQRADPNCCDPHRWMREHQPRRNRRPQTSGT